MTLVVEVKNRIYVGVNLLHCWFASELSHIEHYEHIPMCSVLAVI